VKIFSVASGAVVGVVGGTKLGNSEPSLAPDGSQVVFTRSPAKDSGPGPAIWTAAASGSHLQRLEQHGSSPLWSPAGKQIAYLAPKRGGSVGVAARGATGGCEHDTPAQRPRNRLRLVPERPLDRLPGLEAEALRLRARRDGEGAEAAEARGYV
jgi:WD40-like Beta Propeller Repeat